MHYKYLLDIALILLFTKFLGLFFQRLHMPQVVGSLIAGLLLGPAVLHLVVETAFLETTASLGVILLMFIAGMETDINEMKSCGKSAVVIAVAVLSKLVGCGLGARVTGFDTRQSIQIGVGMVSRGEVALIVASKGADLHLVSKELFGPIIVVVVITTIITPILLKLVFQDRKPSKITMHPTL